VNWRPRRRRSRALTALARGLRLAGGREPVIAVAVAWDGRHQVLAIELANRANRSSWKDFLLALKSRGLSGVEYAVSDDHPGLKAAIREVLPEAAWQRCSLYFLRNALDYAPRNEVDDCLKELRWMDDRRDLAEVRCDLAQWLARWQGNYAKLCAWVEDNIEETLTYCRLPLAHPKHMKSTTMLERLNQEIKRRTQVVRIFPDGASCPRLVRALAGQPGNASQAEDARRGRDDLAARRPSAGSGGVAHRPRGAAYRQRDRAPRR
jgi:putative transposase